MYKNKYHWIKKLMIAAMCVVLLLWVVILTLIFFSKNIAVISPRAESSPKLISGYTLEEKERDNTPLGMIEEYRFIIPTSIIHDTSLDFYVVHQYVEVYVDNECIYELAPSGDLPFIKTVGCNHVSIPVYASDAGKEVSVVLTPVYNDIRARNVEFYLGSAVEILSSQIRKNIVAMSCYLILISLGVFRIAYSVYSRVKKRPQTYESVCHSVLFIAMALWKCFDNRTVQYLYPGSTVFQFYLSLVMFMIGAYPLIGMQNKKYFKKSLFIYSTGALLLGLTSGILQLFGIADLRLFITVIQFFAITSVMILFMQLFLEFKNSNRKILNKAAVAVLIVCGIIDILMYYVTRTSVSTNASLILFVVVAAIMVFVYIDRYQQNMMEIERQKSIIVQSRMNALIGQIRSHFVFNVLNAISGLCKYDPQKADETIICFSRYLRTNIDLMQNDDIVPFSKSLSHFEDYMELQRIRFGDKIRYEEQIETDNFKMPLMVIQPLVENAIRHGILPLPEGGMITLRSWIEDDTVRVSIKDNGVGYTPGTESEKSIGIANVRERLKYSVKGRLEIESAPGCGTTATIIMPLSEINMNEGKKSNACDIC